MSLAHRNIHLEQLPVPDGPYEDLYRRALPYLNTRHNDVHTLIAYGQARLLLAHYPDADESVVLPAIILHDVGWKAVSESEQLTAFGPNMSNRALQRLHETEGVRIAKSILEELGFDQAKLGEVVAIIDGHDTRAAALSLNDRLVRDADRLWRFTPIGLQIDSRRFGFGLDEYLVWIEGQIDKWMSTSEAKQIAREYLVEAARSPAVASSCTQHK